ncbi:hypothetical protein L3D22_09815 [Lysobacter soli]|nr:hypothetical protein [Lysobacter soli]UTA52697.1 hypothetical protein L3D22_09815 [Lysobacter soli]
MEPERAVVETERGSPAGQGLEATVAEPPHRLADITGRRFVVEVLHGRREIDLGRLPPQFDGRRRCGCHGQREREQRREAEADPDRRTFHVVPSATGHAAADR